MKGFKGLMKNKYKESDPKKVGIESLNNIDSVNNNFEDEYKTVYVGRKSKTFSNDSKNNDDIIIKQQTENKGSDNITETVALNEGNINSLNNAKDKIYASLKYCESNVFKEFFMKDLLISIGRDPEICDLTISRDNYIGRNHAVIYYRKGKFYIVDLSSKNGTFVNDKRVEGTIEIFDKDTIKFAKT